MKKMWLTVFALLSCGSGAALADDKNNRKDDDKEYRTETRYYENSPRRGYRHGRPRYRRYYRGYPRHYYYDNDYDGGYYRGYPRRYYYDSNYDGGYYQRRGAVGSAVHSVGNIADAILP